MSVTVVAVSWWVRLTIRSPTQVWEMFRITLRSRIIPGAATLMVSVAPVMSSSGMANGAWRSSQIPPGTGVDVGVGVDVGD